MIHASRKLRDWVVSYVRKGLHSECQEDMEVTSYYIASPCFSATSPNFSLKILAITKNIFTERAFD